MEPRKKKRRKSPFFLAKDIHEIDLKVRMAEFEKWLQLHNVRYPKLTLAPVYYGWGLIAKEDIDANQDCVIVPAELALTIRQARQSIVGQAVSAFDAKNKGYPWVSDKLLFLLYIIYQKHKKQSFYGPYLRSFPNSYSDPLWWDESELKHLHGTDAWRKVSQLKDYLSIVQHNVVECGLSVAFPDIFPPEIFTLTNLKWAQSAVSSRWFPIELVDSSLVSSSDLLPKLHPLHPDNDENKIDRKSANNEIDEDEGISVALGCLLPVIDLANHKTNQPITLNGVEGELIMGQYDEQEDQNDLTDLHNDINENNSEHIVNYEGKDSLLDSRSIHHDVDDDGDGEVRDTIIFHIRYSASRGEEVWNNYGQHPNSALLVEYGFCEENNPYEEVLLAPSFYDILDKDVRSKLSDSSQAAIDQFISRHMLEPLTIHAGVDDYLEILFQLALHPVPNQDPNLRRLDASDQLNIYNLVIGAVEKRLFSHPESTSSSKSTCSSFSSSASSSASLICAYRLIEGERQLMTQLLQRFVKKSEELNAHNGFKQTNE